MQQFFSIMLLLLAIVPAQILFQIYPKIPLAFYQVAVGLLISFLPLYSHFEIKPEVFLLVIISTLMFSDSRKLNLGEFTDTLGETLSVAVGLVVVSILVVGATAHWVTAGLTWSGGFMLAAILAPTDAVAYQSITAGTKLPDGVDNTLQNESLLNDASGLVAFNLVLSAMRTGEFSPIKGFLNFEYVFIGGTVIGLLLGWLYIALRRELIMKKMSINAVIVPFTLASPYIIYFIAEELKASGILAVVAAGLLRTWEQRNWHLSTARIQQTTFAVEDVISSLLNGLVFVILGINLPGVFKAGIDANISGLNIALIGLGLYFLLMLVRFVWFATGLVHVSIINQDKKMLDSLLASVNGVHGTVTLMMALSIPLTVPGVMTQLRATIILIIVVVIGLSMVVPIFATPRLVKSYHLVTAKTSSSEQIWQELLDHALSKIKQMQLPMDVVNFLVPLIVTQRPLQRMNQRKFIHLYRQTQRMEVDLTSKLIQEQKVKLAASRYHQEVITREVLNQQVTPWLTLLYWMKVTGRLFTRHPVMAPEEHDEYQEQRALIEQTVYFEIMEYLRQQDPRYGEVEVNTLARIYSTRHDETLSVEVVNKERFYMLQLFSDEMAYIRHMYRSGTISLDESRRFISDISLQQTIFMDRVF